MGLRGDLKVGSLPLGGRSTKLCPLCAPSGGAGASEAAPWALRIQGGSPEARPHPLQQASPERPQSRSSGPLQPRSSSDKAHRRKTSDVVARWKLALGGISGDLEETGGGGPRTVLLSFEGPFPST